MIRTLIKTLFALSIVACQGIYGAANQTGAEAYFANFDSLAKAEQWAEIISQGTLALEDAKAEGKTEEEAKICAQMTSTFFYRGDYSQALVYANRCRELSEAFDDPALFIRALYLESAIHRALAGKHVDESTQQARYLHAVEIAEQALLIFSDHELHNEGLKGKIYFNLGAAHADNPRGDLSKAAHCYSIALRCFNDINATDDAIRTRLRLGKVYLLQNDYAPSQQTLDEARPFISNERLTMQADYLEAQLKLAIDDIENAMLIARTGLARAQILGAKEDALRLIALIEHIESKRSPF